MTPKEAIEILDNQLKVVECKIMCFRGTEKENTKLFEHRIEIRESIKMAIESLKEVQRYWEIGTVKECRKAIEKQKPKTPDYEGDGYADGKMVYDIWICPNCGKKYEVDYDDYKYCPECGQAILQENLEGMEDE